MSRTQWVVLATIAAALVSTSCGVLKGTTKTNAGRPLIEDVTQVLLGHDGTAADADNAMAKLLDASKGKFTGQDWKVRSSFEAMSTQVTQWDSAQTTTIRTRSAVLSATASAATVPAEIRRTLAQIADDAATGIGCATIHSVAFPGTPPAKSSADGAWNLTGDELIGAARQVLLGKYGGAAGAGINWFEWAVQVKDLGGDVYAALIANRLPYANLLDRPEVQRATLAYFEHCLAPPVPLR